MRFSACYNPCQVSIYLLLTYPCHHGAPSVPRFRGMSSTWKEVSGDDEHVQAPETPTAAPVVGTQVWTTSGVGSPESPEELPAGTSTHTDSAVALPTGDSAAALFALHGGGSSGGGGKDGGGMDGGGGNDGGGVIGG